MITIALRVCPYTERIEVKTRDLHRKSFELITGQSVTGSVVGPDRTVCLSHYDYLYKPELPVKSLNDAIEGNIADTAEPFAVLLDFTWYPYWVRDPIVENLATALTQIQKLPKLIVFLVSSAPSTESNPIASKILGAIEQTNQQFVFADSSRITTLTDCGTFEISEIPSEYTAMLVEQYGDPYTRLQNKSVRLLGHFARSSSEQGCREDSFVTYDCEWELYQLFSSWFDELNSVEAIAYSSRNNPEFQNALIAIQAEYDLQLIDLDAAIDDDGLLDPLTGKPTVLAIDAIETGETVAAFAELLIERQAILRQPIFTVIQKQYTKIPVFGGERQLDVKSLLQLPKSFETSVPCEQCGLDLPHTDNHLSQYHPIRIYDFLSLIEKYGWYDEEAQETPDYRKLARDLPNFPEFIRHHGDWIAYKLELLIRSHNLPSDVIVAFPEEPDVIALVDAWKKLTAITPTFVPVSKRHIENSKLDDWQYHLEQSRTDGDPWIESIEGLNSPDKGMFWLDVFALTSSTASAMVKLSENLNIPLLGLFFVCILDRSRFDIAHPATPLIDFASKYVERTTTSVTGN